jgi:hypothetical protein
MAKRINLEPQYAMVNPKMWADYEISYSDKTGIIFYDELFQMNQLFMSSVDKDEVFARML